MLTWLPWAEALQVPYLRVFDGGEVAHLPDPAIIEEASEAVSWWQALRRKKGWHANIAMETHDAFCQQQSCLALQERLDEPLPILWDAHHTWHKAGEAMEDTWKALKPSICHVHYIDSQSVGNETNDYICVVPGKGQFPTAELFKLLRQ